MYRVCVFFLMRRRPPRSTRTDTLFPYTTLCRSLSWLVGGRDSEYALAFMDDLRSRLANRVQLTSDGHRAYLEARSEEHTSELQSLMRISYAVFCLKKKTNQTHRPRNVQLVNRNLNPTTKITITKHLTTIHN